MADYQIIASPTFKITLARLFAFLTRKYSESLANETKEQIKLHLLEHLSQNPLIAPPSERLIELGIKGYRQISILEHNLVYYRVDESKKRVILLAVMDGRQSIEKLLFEVNLLR